MEKSPSVHFTGIDNRGFEKADLDLKQPSPSLESTEAPIEPVVEPNVEAERHEQPLSDFERAQKDLEEKRFAMIKAKFAMDKGPQKSSLDIAERETEGELHAKYADALASYTLAKQLVTSQKLEKLMASGIPQSKALEQLFAKNSHDEYLAYVQAEDAARVEAFPKSKIREQGRKLLDKYRTLNWKKKLGYGLAASTSGAALGVGAVAIASRALGVASAYVGTKEGLGTKFADRQVRKQFSAHAKERVHAFEGGRTEISPESRRAALEKFLHNEDQRFVEQLPQLVKDKKRRERLIGALGASATFALGHYIGSTVSEKLEAWLAGAPASIDVPREIAPASASHSEQLDDLLAGIQSDKGHGYYEYTEGDYEAGSDAADQSSAEGTSKTDIEAPEASDSEEVVSVEVGASSTDAVTRDVEALAEAQNEVLEKVALPDGPVDVVIEKDSSVTAALSQDPGLKAVIDQAFVDRGLDLSDVTDKDRAYFVYQRLEDYAQGLADSGRYPGETVQSIMDRFDNVWAGKSVSVEILDDGTWSVPDTSENVLAVQNLALPEIVEPLPGTLDQSVEVATEAVADAETDADVDADALTETEREVQEMFDIDHDAEKAPEQIVEVKPTPEITPEVVVEQPHPDATVTNPDVGPLPPVAGVDPETLPEAANDAAYEAAPYTPEQLNEVYETLKARREIEFAFKGTEQPFPVLKDVQVNDILTDPRWEGTPDRAAVEGIIADAKTYLGQDIMAEKVGTGTLGELMANTYLHAAEKSTGTIHDIFGTRSLSDRVAEVFAGRPDAQSFYHEVANENLQKRFLEFSGVDDPAHITHQQFLDFIKSGGVSNQYDIYVRLSPEQQYDALTKSRMPDLAKLKDLFLDQFSARYASRDAERFVGKETFDALQQRVSSILGNNFAAAKEDESIADYFERVAHALIANEKDSYEYVLTGKSELLASK